MADPDPALLWSHKPPPPRKLKPGELLFEFVCASDSAPIRCELLFHGESAGSEVRFVEPTNCELYARSGFMLRELAVKWAEVERGAMLRDSRS